MSAIRFLLAALAFALPLLAAPAAAQPAPDVDTIVARHIAARGGAERLRALRTLVFDQGRYEEGSYRDDGAVMMLGRPYYKLVGHPQRDGNFMEGYDGAAWEWFGEQGIVVRTTHAASAALRHYADVEGPFLDWRSKGHRVELVGPATVAGRPTWQVRLVMMDGYSTENFIDRETWLIVATRHSAPVHAYGRPVTSETRFGDHRPVAGVLFPFRSEEVEIASGHVLNAMQWGRIDANVDIPVAWFSPPLFERTRLQAFMEQLYGQRADPQAVLWTYHWFRRSFPEEDTRNAAQVIGYQMLKMEATEAAIALLERNAADHPDAADSAFGLGRALATAGQTDRARAEYERALRLQPGHARANCALALLPAPPAGC